MYDPLAGTWTVTGSLNVNRPGDHRATLLPNGKVLVTGGCPCLTEGDLPAAEVYDPASGANQRVIPVSHPAGTGPVVPTVTGSQVIEQRGAALTTFGPPS